MNVRETLGFRTELALFGGIKASGLGVKEGVAEASAPVQRVPAARASFR